MVNALKRFWKDEDGITMIEYSLMAAAVATVSDRGNRASP
jgi:Flp pilus assembly pilin Flp